MPLSKDLLDYLRFLHKDIATHELDPWNLSVQKWIKNYEKNGPMSNFPTLPPKKAPRQT